MFKKCYLLKVGFFNDTLFGKKNTNYFLHNDILMFKNKLFELNSIFAKFKMIICL